MSYTYVTEKGECAKRKLRGCRDDSTVKNTYCFSRRPEFPARKQVTKDHLLFQFWGVWCPLLASTHNCTNTHMYINKIKYILAQKEAERRLGKGAHVCQLIASLPALGKILVCRCYWTELAPSHSTSSALYIGESFGAQ